MNVKDSIRSGIDSIIKGDLDAATRYFSVVMPEKSRQILSGEQDTDDELTDEEVENAEEVNDTDDDEVTGEDDLVLFDDDDSEESDKKS